MADSEIEFQRLLDEFVRDLEEVKTVPVILNEKVLVDLAIFSRCQEMWLVVLGCPEALLR